MIKGTGGDAESPLLNNESLGYSKKIVMKKKIMRVELIPRFHCISAEVQREGYRDFDQLPDDLAGHRRALGVSHRIVLRGEDTFLLCQLWEEAFSSKEAGRMTSALPPLRRSVPT
jgi:hypothetical protein